MTTRMVKKADEDYANYKSSDEVTAAEEKETNFVES